MAFTRIKERISTLVPNQLPEFVRSDYATFVAFLEAYYEFLEQDQAPHEVIQNIRSYADIDRTIDSFIEYFIRQYCDTIPRTVLYNKKELVKNIQDLYNNKGSEKAYRLLFQILFNKNIDFLYPYQQVLKASDGKWVQRTSFFMKTVTGNGASIIGQNLLIKSTSTTFPISIVNRRAASSSSGIVNDIHEYFYDNSKNVAINVGDIIEYNNFKGEVVGAAVNASVVAPGSGFRVGDILPLTAGAGNAAKLKVTKVNSTGGILNVQFLSFGIGYLTSFYNFFSRTTAPTTAPTFSFDGSSAIITESLSGFVESGTITQTSALTSYAVTGYFAADYQGELLSQFFTDTTTFAPEETNPTGTIIQSSSGTIQDAAIFVQLGPKAKYQGYYATTDGFLSDNIYLEDQDYFQPFSYVLKVDERLSDFKNVVLDLLHPAGTKLFSDLTLTANIDTITELAAVLRFLTSYFQDRFGLEDTVTKNMLKTASEDFVLTSETIVSDVQKLLEDNLTQFSDQNLSRSLVRPVASSSIPTDSVFNFAFIKSIIEPVSVVDQTTIIGIKSITVNDSVIVKDPGQACNFNYAEVGYFAEEYACELTVFGDINNLPIGEGLAPSDSGSVYKLDYGVPAENYFAEAYAGSETTF